MSWYLVIDLGMPYSGVEIEQGSGPRSTRIKIPFMDQDGADNLRVILAGRISVQRAQQVIAGNVEEDDDDDRD